MKFKIITILFGIFLVLSLCAQSDDTLRVLFVGNSQTYFNNMPDLFDSLSESGGRPLITGMSAPGGYTLEQHTNDSTTISMIEQGNWHYVVLQEQSQIPTINHWRFNSMYPATRRLDSTITQHNESTTFFMTWGWKYGGQMIYNGDSSPFFVNYFHMQESVRVAYESIASELSATLCPVGMAWARARTIDTLVDLWMPDNYHPTLKGSYLAACVFYSVFFKASPVGLPYNGGLSPEDALFFQNVAWQTISVIEEHHKPPPAERYSLKIYPNPFNAQTAITLPYAANLEIYNATGQLIKSYTNPQPLTPKKCFTWDGRDRYNQRVSDGIYFFRLFTADRTIINKVVLTH